MVLVLFLGVFVVVLPGSLLLLERWMQPGHAPEPPRPRPREQLAGRSCDECGRKIITILDGRTCRRCAAPLHDECVPAHPHSQPPLGPYR